MTQSKNDIQHLCPICLNKARAFENYSKFAGHWQMLHHEYQKPTKEEMRAMMANDGAGLRSFVPVPLNPEAAQQEPQPAASPPPAEAAAAAQFPADAAVAAGPQPPAAPPAAPPPQQPAPQPPQAQPQGQPAATGGNMQQGPGYPPNPNDPMNFTRIDPQMMTDDPLMRLAMILYVHGVPDKVRETIMGIVQLHPDHLQNPLNLHALLGNTLDKRFQPRVQLMVSEFMSHENRQEDPFGYIPPLQPGAQTGQGGYNAGAGMYPQNYPGYGKQNQYVYPNMMQPLTQPQGPEQQLQSLVAMMTSMFKAMTEMTGAGGGSNEEAKELRQEIRSMREASLQSAETFRKENQDMRMQYEKDMRDVMETSRQQVEEMRDQLHADRMERLQQQVSALQHARAEEMSEGLGSLIRDLGEGVGAEMSAIRENVDKGLSQIGGIVKTTMTAPGAASPEAESSDSPEDSSPHRSIAEATELMETEEAINYYANEVVREQQSPDVAPGQQ